MRYLAPLERSFDTRMVYPDNREPTPRGVPLNPMAAIPAIARFVWGDQEEWRPVTVNRWVQDHVLVLFRVDPADPRSETGCWMNARDVRGAIRGTGSQLSLTWAATTPQRRRDPRPGPPDPRGRRIAS